MPLTICPDCEREVSDRAPSCPHCGCPMAAQVTERTAKRHKAMQLVGGLVMCVATVMFIAALPHAEEDTTRLGVSMIVGLVGLLIYAGARFAAWWHHG